MFTVANTLLLIWLLNMQLACVNQIKRY